MEIKDKKDTDLLLEDLKGLEGYINDLWLFFPIPICFVNTAFNILNGSRALEEITGQLGTEIIGENLENMLKNPKNIFQELKNKETIRDKEMILFIKDKKEVLVNVSAKTRKDEEGDVLGYFFSFIDLMEIREKEIELQKKIEQLEKFQKVAVGREIKMAALKKELDQFKKS
ncbi:PAS domain-containing protein [Patescibacteria group bacterium]